MTLTFFVFFRALRGSSKQHPCVSSATAGVIQAAADRVLSAAAIRRPNPRHIAAL
jgi:hypothetical protein